MKQKRYYWSTTKTNVSNNNHDTPQYSMVPLDAVQLKSGVNNSTLLKSLPQNSDVFFFVLRKEGSNCIHNKGSIQLALGFLESTE
mmetsp:Transcript_9406/g.17725  ORF Transcript_9406/g.17725 Transcript_9406/m.17725 type:complete len:85 (+) Transcript_9406:845-1099(+)